MRHALRGKDFGSSSAIMHASLTNLLLTVVHSRIDTQAYSLKPKAEVIPVAGAERRTACAKILVGGSLDAHSCSLGIACNSLLLYI